MVTLRTGPAGWRAYRYVWLCLVHIGCAAGGTSLTPTERSAATPAGQEQPTDVVSAAPAPVVLDPNVVALDAAGDGEFVIGPNYVNGPDRVGSDANHTGMLKAFTLNSQDSNFYNGLDPTLNSPQSFTRNGWAYIPAGYVEWQEIAFMVVQDGSHYKGLTSRIDYLIEHRLIPPMVVIFIDPGPGDSFGSERGLEYDTVSPKYGEYVQSELLPYVRDTYHINFTDDPNGRAVMGCSSGGVAAFTMAWFHPELFSRVLSYSGTFVHQHTDDTFPHGAWTYHERLILEAAPKPIRVAFEVGQNDLNLEDRNDGMHSWTIANGRMAVCLRAKGYHYKYYYALGAGHVDGDAINQTFGEAMTWLWRGYPIP